jgi:transcriptional regulator with XRE-family HTH domain
MSKSRKKFSDGLPLIAENIRAWRLHRKFTQGELEQRAGLSHNTISRIETDAVSPRLDTVKGIARALELSVEELQFGKPPLAVAEEAADYEVKKVASRLMSLKEEKRAPILEAFNTLLDQVES